MAYALALMRAQAIEIVLALMATVGARVKQVRA